MAAVNPFDAIFSSEVDENAVKDLVGSLEYCLASTTSKESINTIQQNAVNTNHINNTPTSCVVSTDSNLPPYNTNVPNAGGLDVSNNVSGQRNSPVTQINDIGGKPMLSDSQILGISSIQNLSTPVSSVNSPSVSEVNLNSPHITSTISDNTKVPTSGAIRIITQPQQAVITLPSTNTFPNNIATNIRTLAPNTVVTIPVCSHSRQTVINTVTSNSIICSVAHVKQEGKPLVISQTSDSKIMQQNPLLNASNQMDKKNGAVSQMQPSSVKQETNVQLKQESAGSPYSVKLLGNTTVKQEVQPQKEIVARQVIHSGQHRQVIQAKGPQQISNPSVITVRTSQPQVTVMRPQIISSQTSQGTSAAQMQIVNVSATATGALRPGGSSNVTHGKAPVRLNTPIRISSQPTHQQINIAPRPGGTNTITLPPGLAIGPGTVLMKNEQGQLVLVPGQPGIQTATTIPNKVQNIRVPSSTSHQRPQTIVAIQHPHGTGSPQPVIRPSVPRTSIAHSAPSMQSSTPQSIVQTAVRNTAPIIGTPHVDANPTPATQGNHQQQMLENVKKCKNFLSTLIKLASRQPQETVKNVRELIQGLIDGKVEPEMFTEKLQVELKSSPQPLLVPFLKKSLPMLRHYLITNKMTIEDVKPPPTDMIPPPQHLSQVSLHPPHISMSSVLQQPGGLTPGTPTQHAAARHGGKVHHSPSTHHQKLQAKGAMPTTISALEAQMAANSKDGSSNLHKDKRKYESLKDDDDINDVATMGGVNLSEESKNILATNADFIGTQIRSCKDELFLDSSCLIGRIKAIGNKFGVSDISPDVVNLISHATQERLRDIVEKLATIAEHRLEMYKMDSRFEVTTEVKSQLKFLEEIDKLEKKKHEEQEREMLLRVVKSRSKNEDPEQLKLKQKAKELQQLELEAVRQKETNLTALIASGKRRKTQIGVLGQKTLDGSSLANGFSSTPNRPTMMKPRKKCVNLRDLLFLLEQERSTNKSNVLYKTYLK